MDSIEPLSSKELPHGGGGGAQINTHANSNQFHTFLLIAMRIQKQNKWIIKSTHLKDLNKNIRKISTKILENV